MTSETDLDWLVLNRPQCAELLEKICDSAELRRSGRLRDFLRFVGQRALQPENSPVSEYEIGVKVFERREGYDTSADNIVRVNASELRKRIAAYYAADGANEAIQLEIPLRTYTPQFRPRPVKLLPPAASPEVALPHLFEPEPVPDLDTVPMAQQPKLLRWLPYLACCLLAVICAFLVYDRQATKKQIYGWRSEPTIGPFWRGMLDSSRPTDVVLADTSFAMVEDTLKKRISLNDYLSHGYVAQIQASGLSPDVKSNLLIIATRSNGSLGEFRVAQKILAFDPLSKRTHLQYARDYVPSAIKSDNLVLIGSSHSNPWCSLFEDRLNFVLDYDPEMNGMVVRNRRPQAGESPEYLSMVDPNSPSGYGVVDYLPNNGHTADVLIIAGTTSEATEAAGEFVTSEDSFHRLREQLHLQQIPYFELLLKTTKLIGTPLSAQIIAFGSLLDGYR